jgi:hypothetical protein
VIGFSNCIGRRAGWTEHPAGAPGVSAESSSVGATPSKIDPPVPVYPVRAGRVQERGSGVQRLGAGICGWGYRCRMYSRCARSSFLCLGTHSSPFPLTRLRVACSRSSPPTRPWAGKTPEWGPGGPKPLRMSSFLSCPSDPPRTAHPIPYPVVFGLVCTIGKIPRGLYEMNVGTPFLKYGGVFIPCRSRQAACRLPYRRAVRRGLAYRLRVVIENTEKRGCCKHERGNLRCPRSRGDRPTARTPDIRVCSRALLLL